MEVETIMIKNLITAEDARKEANKANNERIAYHLDTIMGYIKKSCQKGNSWINYNYTEDSECREKIIKILETFGYEVIRKDSTWLTIKW